MREVIIRKANRGFIVVVGCQTFVFEAEASMLMAISQYFKDPHSAEKEYVDESFQTPSTATLNEDVPVRMGTRP